MFTADVPQTPTTAISPTVVDTLFGGRYPSSVRRSNYNFDAPEGTNNDGVPSNGSFSPFGPPNNFDAMDWGARADAARANPTALGAAGSFAGTLLGLGPLSSLLGVGVRYGVPVISDYMRGRALESVQSRADQALAGRASNISGYDYSGLNPAFGPTHSDYGDFGYDGPASNNGGGGGFTDAGGGVVGGDQAGYDGNW
jgi:hypothetical protein